MRGIDRELGLRQLAAMLKGGLALLPALETCAEQSPAGPSRVWRRVAAAVATGARFSSALRAERGFDGYLVALVEVGEETGELDRTLAAAAEYLERRREHRALVVNALFYPVTVVLMTGGVVWFMMAKVVPALKQFLEAQSRQLPAMTRALIDLSDALAESGPRWVLAAVAGMLALWLARRHRDFRDFSDGLLMRLPVVGRILRLSATAVFARSLSLLVESGVTLVSGLDSVRGLFRNERLVRRLLAVREEVLRGSALSAALAAAGEFLPMLRRMVAVGESAGTLGATLAEVAGYHEERLRSAIRRFGMVIEPLMIVLVGGIVGFVYISFFLAIFALAGSAR